MRKSYKNVSDSCLAKFRACETQEFWSMQISKAASEADLARYVQVPNHDRQNDRREPEELLFNRIVSDNVLLRPTSPLRVCEESHGTEAQEQFGCHFSFERSERTSAGIWGKIGGLYSRRSQRSETTDEHPTTCRRQVLWWKDHQKNTTRHVDRHQCRFLRPPPLEFASRHPEKTSKVGGFIGNLLVTKVDLKSAHVDLKLQTIGFDHDTLEETEYSEVLGYLHYWSGLPEAPPFARQAPESPAPVKDFGPRPLAPRKFRLNRMGRNGPRRGGGWDRFPRSCWQCLRDLLTLPHLEFHYITGNGCGIRPNPEYRVRACCQVKWW